MQDWKTKQNNEAAYGRSLYALAIGLFSGWWTLMGLWGDGCCEYGMRCGV